MDLEDSRNIQADARIGIQSTPFSFSGKCEKLYYNAMAVLT